MEELTSGAFAKLCHISKKTLFLYDKLDLLKPIRIGDNNYRYYTLEQADRLSTIKLLQELGSSLTEISNFFNLPTLENKAAFLATQHLKLQQKLHTINTMDKQLNFLIHRLHHFEKIGENTFFTETLTAPEYYFVTKMDPGFILNSLDYGIQYGVLFNDNSDSNKLTVFKQVASQNANYIKPIGNYLCVYKVLKNEEMTTSVLNVRKQMQAIAKLEGPLYQEDYCSTIAEIDNKVVIKFSCKLSN